MFQLTLGNLSFLQSPDIINIYISFLLEEIPSPTLSLQVSSVFFHHPFFRLFSPTFSLSILFLSHALQCSFIGGYFYCKLEDVSFPTFALPQVSLISSPESLKLKFPLILMCWVNIQPQLPCRVG